MFRLKSAIKKLHARKDRAYRGAWKRRGEKISVVPNIARKVDRLAAFAEDGIQSVDEHIVDTTIDLYVYCLKYLLFLAEKDAALAEQLSLQGGPSPLTDNCENFDTLIEARAFVLAPDCTDIEVIRKLEVAFEELWPKVEADAANNTKGQLLMHLIALTEALLLLVEMKHSKAVESFIDKELA